MVNMLVRSTPHTRAHTQRTAYCCTGVHNALRSIVICDERQPLIAEEQNEKLIYFVLFSFNFSIFKFALIQQYSSTEFRLLLGVHETMAFVCDWNSISKLVLDLLR